uniref:UBP-type domain-containing protein n=1 Tax=Leersia perrieri TaxID=77586 RepID=A0A0D9V488_9ORYZ
MSSSSAAAAAGVGSGEPSSSSPAGKEKEEDGGGGKEWEEEVDFDLSGAAAGWVEAQTSFPHLTSMPAAGADDLARVRPPDSPCSRCHHPAENWLCLICKDIMCSRFINKHMLYHYQETGHCLALSFSDLSLWCFACDSYLDVQAILELRPVYEVAHLLKFAHTNAEKTGDAATSPPVATSTP